MSDNTYDTLIQKAEEAERTSRQPDPERDPGGTRDSVNEWGRNVAYGRAQAFREAAELLRAAS
jgi:hypothetical protein